MADQVSPGTVAGFPQQPGTPAERGQAHDGVFEVFHGRPVSWVAVSLIMVGFLAGGLGLVFGPTWWLFWVGGGLAVLGGLLGMATHIMDDWY